MTVLTTAGELLARPADVLLDVRWALGDDRGRERYLAGHLPGAVFVDLPTELSAGPSPEAGRHPLPSVQRLQAAARRWGISPGSRVVAYDDTGGLAAGRAWWLLRWGGLPDVTLLDGGLAAWTAAGGSLETGDVVPPPGTVELTGGAMPVLDADAAAALPGAAGCCWTPVPPSGSVARWSRSIPGPVTCPEPSAHPRPRPSTPMAGSFQPLY